MFRKLKSIAASKYGLLIAVALLFLAFAAFKAFSLLKLPFGLAVAMLFLAASVAITAYYFYFSKRKLLMLLFFIVAFVEGLALSPAILGVSLAYLPAILVTYAAYVMRKQPAPKGGDAREKNPKRAENRSKKSQHA